MAGKYAINWKKASKAIEDVGYILMTKYPDQIGRLLNWYEKEVGNKAALDTPEMIKWVIAGIPIMRTITEILNKELEIRQNKLQKMYQQSVSAEGTMTQTKGTRDAINNFEDLIDEFLGCRGNVAEWYVSILRYLASVRPGEKVFQNTIPYFDTVCSEVRLHRLRKQ